MSLPPGTRLGSYEVVARLGAGGMGEVYRARDTALNRDIAIKVLPAEFALDGERLSRFRREAQVLAALNHPNIAAIYGLHEAGGLVALALELVEGEDLAARIERGPVPVAEAIAIASQLTDGLEAAHEKGIVHRDLKPANLKLTRDGTLKILDFGLAKAHDVDPAVAGSALLESPTMTRHVTQAGLIVGTAAYMSPEQARGAPVDKRSDIWSFGVVLYEMLTGRGLFRGPTVSDLLAAVLTHDPDWAALPPSTPPGVRRLLARCLERDPRRRLRDIGDARPDLEHVAVPAAVTPSSARRMAGALPWILAALALTAGGAAWLTRPAPGATAGEVVHLDIGYPPDVEPASTLSGGVGISPDGRIVAMVGVRDGVRRIYVRRLDRTDAVEVNDTGGVNTVTFSPDSASIAFVAGSAAVMTLSLVDQQRRVVATGADLGTSVTWSPVGLMFVRNGEVWIAAEEGGEPRRLTALDAARRELLHTDPMALPGARIVLFSSVTSEPGAERIEAIPVGGGVRRVVVERATTPVWSPTGHLLFARDGAVLAVPFDPDTASVRGTAVPVLPAGAVGTVRSGSLGLHLSASGTLLLVPPGLDAKRVVSVNRDRSEIELDFPIGRYANPRVSPDGRRLLVEKDGDVVEALDLARGTRSQLTTAAMGTNFVTWGAAGDRIVFRRFNIPHWAAADGSGLQGPIPGGAINDYPSCAGPDPDSVIAVRVRPETAGDIFLMSISGRFPPKPLVVTPAYEGGAQLSPDGRWLVYQSNSSGRSEIYLRRFPALDRQWQVSEGGGVQARWNGSGREIYYRSGQRVMAVTVDPSGPEPVFGTPVALFPDQYDFGQGISIANYDVTRDGRFIMLRRGPRGGRLHIAINWTEELKRILPPQAR